MAIQTINLGNVVNDGLGDDLRTAFQKVNANFTTLENALSVTVSTTTGTNGYSLFKEQIGSNLLFKTISSGTKIRVDDAGDTIIINNTDPYAFTRIDTNAGRIQADDANLGRITIQGGKDIDVTANGTVMTVNTVLPITNILSTFDFGPIGSNFETPVQLSMAMSNIDFGTVSIPGRLDLDQGRIGPSSDVQHYTDASITPVVTIRIATPIAGDNILSAGEAANPAIAIEGVVSGAWTVGDTVIVRVNGKDFTTTVQADGSFTVNVPGADLAADPGSRITATWYPV